MCGRGVEIVCGKCACRGLCVRSVVCGVGGWRLCVGIKCVRGGGV